MFPTTTITNSSSTSEASIKKSFLFDFKSGDFVIKNGKLVEVSGVEALKVGIEKVLRTEKFKFKVYEKQVSTLEYGITLQDLLIGQNYPKEFIESEIKREVTQAILKNHPIVQRLDNWVIEKNNPILNISFRVVLKNGSSFSEEVTI